jgi:hypothetical protein
MGTISGDWFDEQGGGNVVPIESGYDPNAVKSLGSIGGGLKSGEPFHQTQPVRDGGQQQGGQQPYSDQALQDILHRYAPTYEGVQQAAAEVDRVFGPGVVKLLDHPTKLDKFQLPDGRVIDTVIGAGGGNPSWTWAPEGPGHGGGGAGGGTLGGLSGVGVSPEGQAFSNMVMRSAGNVGPLLGDPMAGRPITDDPSYGFRFGEGVKALERSAAAKGTLLTGGHMKALARYGQDMASTEYQNSYNRRAGEQSNDYNRLHTLGQFMSGEQQNQFNRYLGAGQLGLGNYNAGLNATTAAQNNAGGYASSIGNAQIGQGNAAAGSAIAQGNANAGMYTGIGNAIGQTGTNWYNNRRQPGEV